MLSDLLRRRRMRMYVVAVCAVLAFAWAMATRPKRVNESRITQLYNHALIHAHIAWNDFDPDERRPVPRDIVVDLSDPDTARQSRDPMIAEAAEKYPGCKYVIRFERNVLAVEGASVVANIEVNGADGRTLSTKQFLTRRGASITNRFRSSPIECD
jgi:hypothetical protein